MRMNSGGGAPRFDSRSSNPAFGSPLMTTASTRLRRCAGSRSGPAGNSRPLPRPRAPSMTTSSKSRASRRCCKPSSQRMTSAPSSIRRRAAASRSGGHHHRNSSAPLQQHRLIAKAAPVRCRVDLLSARSPRAIAPGGDAHLAAEGAQLPGEPGHHRRLAGAANGQIADDDHRTSDSRGGAAPRGHDPSVRPRQRCQEPPARPPLHTRSGSDVAVPTPHAPSALELEGMQLRVQATMGQKLGMRAALGDATCFEHDDPVGLLHR